MALTDHSDIYVAVTDAGVQRVINHVRGQRPSLFNYGSAFVVQHPDIACVEIDAHPVVHQRNNPLMSVGPTLPVFGTQFPTYSVNYSAQLRTLDIDFHTGDRVVLPSELDPLRPQHLALQIGGCFGFGCPPDEVVDALPPSGDSDIDDRREPVPIPTRELICTCLDRFRTASVDFIGPRGNQRLRATLGGIELVDLEPETLENSIECYLELALKLGVLPKLEVPVIKLTEDLMGLVTATLEPSITSPDLPHNPAIEDDHLKVFLELSAGPVAGTSAAPVAAAGGGGGGVGAPVHPGSPRARARAGDFDATAAASANAVVELFNIVRDSFTFSWSASGDFGPFTASADVDARLENGTLTLENDNKIKISELDVVFEELEFCLGIDIPRICVGGFCIIPNPLGGCILRAPRVCIFGADPDIEFCLDLAALVRSEISATLRPISKYSVNPGRAPGMNDWDAYDAKMPNHWQIFVDPLTIDLDLFDVEGIVESLINQAVDAALDSILGPLPGWAKDLIKAILGPTIDVVGDILDFGDDVGEWLSDLLGVSLGLFNVIVTAVADLLAKDRPLIEIEDPVEVVPPRGALIPVLVPIEFLGVNVDTDELTVNADIGD